MVKFEEGINKWRINRIKIFSKDKEWFEDSNKPITTFEDPEGGIITINTVNQKNVRYHKIILLIFSQDGAKKIDYLLDDLGYWLRENTYTNMYKNNKNKNPILKVEITLKAKDYILYCE